MEAPANLFERRANSYDFHDGRPHHPGPLRDIYLSRVREPHASCPICALADLAGRNLSFLVRQRVTYVTRNTCVRLSINAFSRDKKLLLRQKEREFLIEKEKKFYDIAIWVVRRDHTGKRVIMHHRRDRGASVITNFTVLSALLIDCALISAASDYIIIISDVSPQFSGK